MDAPTASVTMRNGGCRRRRRGCYSAMPSAATAA
eukprot:SAG11_NODE_4467_length_1885_cov_1.603024_1_plen_33_part_10